MNRLADSVSPYLRSHAGNPVDWWPWGAEPFEEARRRDVPVLVSIGYATCHWCHVMARESFSDEAVAELLRDRFVSIKVDREEHPEVDASYLAAAGAFTQNLGWPLTAFATPEGRVFFAATYLPPQSAGGHPSFRQVLDAVWEAWTERREQVEDTSARLAEAIVRPVVDLDGAPAARVDFAPAVLALAQHEDDTYGGFGGAPKFPVAPVLLMLQRLGESPLLDEGERALAGMLAGRTLDAMAASPLRDAVEGGFFRYGTRRDWSEPHYERMLYDNALLLRAYGRRGSSAVAEGIVSFLERVLRREGGAFGSAQDSESHVDGVRTEGGYYALDAAERERQPAPAVDGKVLTGWNGLAIGALAEAGARLGRADWIDLARDAAGYLLEHHLDGDRLIRASLDGRRSAAAATLEDHGMLARGLLDLAVASGEVRWASAARRLVDAVVDRDGALRAPGGGDPTLAGQGLALSVDPSEGAYPSGISQTASAALTLYELTGEGRYREIAERAVLPLAPLATTRPISMGGTLEVLATLLEPSRELVVITADRAGALAAAAERLATTLTLLLTPDQAAAFEAEGFALLADRLPRDGGDIAYLCEDLVCRLPVRSAEELLTLATS